MPDRLRDGGPEYDLLVIGGGINGAGVARDAALRGYRVVLVEKGDFGCGSSSRTSKLVHGGIRYLEHGALRLVWEASRERRRLLRLAPHLVRPLPFVFPIFTGSRIGMLRLRAGMWLYDVLAAFRNVRPHTMLSRRDAETWREGLRRDGLRGAALYYDAVMDDARLVLANVLSAREAGALVLNRVQATSLRFEGGAARGADLHDLESGARVALRARCIVACAGPWSNEFLGTMHGAMRPLAPTRGTHIVVRRLGERAFTLAAARDGRVFFVLPWVGMTLVGTTDVDDAGDPDRVTPTRAEIDYLLEEANRFFPEAQLERGDIVAAFAGLRPLLANSGDASARSREHAVLEPVPGLLAVVGGKYTTYRAVAEAVVDRVQRQLGSRGRCRTAREPLPGGDLQLPRELVGEATARGWSPEDHWNAGPEFIAAVEALCACTGIEADTARHLLQTYGSRAAPIIGILSQNRDLAKPLCVHQPHVRAEVVHAVRSEMALHLEDWFLRRTRIGFGPCHGLDALEETAALFAAELRWDAPRRRSEMENCRAAIGELSNVH